MAKNPNAAKIENCYEAGLVDLVIYSEKERSAQLIAYDNRDKIALGDAFVWHFSGGYGSSGQLPRLYMRVSVQWQGEKVLRVCHVNEGRNGYGPFVDYYLNEEGIYDGVPGHCIIINGPDAFKMEKAKKVQT